MTPPSHLRETTFRPSTGHPRTNRLASLASTGTFLDHLPGSGVAASDVTARHCIPDVGVMIQLLTLRAIDGERALETELGIPIAPDAGPAERMLLSGARLLDATRDHILASGPDGVRLTQELFRPSDGIDARVRVTDLVSLHRRWGAAANGMAAGSRTASGIRPGVVLLGALCVRSADLASLGTLFTALDRAAAHGLPSFGHPPGACQLDVLAIVGGTLEQLPSVASIVQGQEHRSWAHAASPAHDSWWQAPYRLAGRDARRAASRIARESPSNLHFRLLA